MGVKLTKSRYSVVSRIGLLSMIRTSGLWARESLGVSMSVWVWPSQMEQTKGKSSLIFPCTSKADCTAHHTSEWRNNFSLAMPSRTINLLPHQNSMGGALNFQHQAPGCGFQWNYTYTKIIHSTPYISQVNLRIYAQLIHVSSYNIWITYEITCWLRETSPSRNVDQIFFLHTCIHFVYLITSQASLSRQLACIYVQ